MLEFEAKVRRAQDELNAKFGNPADFEKNAAGWSNRTLSNVLSTSIDPTNQKRIKCSIQINKISLRYLYFWGSPMFFRKPEASWDFSGYLSLKNAMSSQECEITDVSCEISMKLLLKFTARYWCNIISLHKWWFILVTARLTDQDVRLLVTKWPFTYRLYSIALLLTSRKYCTVAVNR